jgi:hypothetical protein
MAVTGNLSKKTSKFSRNQMALFILVFAAVGGFILWRSFAAGPVVASLETEQMNLPANSSVVTDSLASAGQAVRLDAAGTLTGAVTLPAQATSMTVSARATQCSGSPNLSVAVDGSSLINTAVASSSWNSYSATTALSSGSHNLTISASNMAVVKHGKPNPKKPGCTRTVYLDVTTFYGQTAPPPPAPTVSLSASPATVNAGAASTLTWNASNATAPCTASGAWSGDRLTSGSVTTGALNNSSTYTLTCTGAGGTASASTTVTVSTSSTPNPPTVYLKPGTQAYALGSTITLEVRENSGTTPVNAVQANFSYPTDKLTFVSIDATSSAFTTEAQSTGSNGQVSLGRGIIGTLSGDQLVAKVTFKVNTVAGTASVPFTNGTMIISSSANQNVLPSLAATGPGSYTLQ